MMPPDEKTVVQPIAPVVVTVVGSGTGDGGAPIQSGTLKTPDHQPDVRVEVVAPIVAMAVRFGYTFAYSLSGLMVAAMTPAGSKVLYTGDFFHLVETCANLSFPIAGAGLIKDLVTILGNLEKRYPLLTGSV